MITMCDDVTDNQAFRDELVARLKESPVAYRHVLGIIDPEFDGQGWPAEEWRLYRIGSMPLLLVSQSKEGCAYVMVWDGPDDVGALGVNRFLDEHMVSQLVVLGEATFRALRPRLSDGAWRLSRNYELTALGFEPRPSELVRGLTADDRAHLEKTIRTHDAAAHRSTTRDFDTIAEGRPVRCWGAFMEGDLAGFVSTNPICAGVTEVSWIFTAEPFRGRGIAAGLLTAACEDAFARGEAVGYHAGSAGDDLDRMVRNLGFQETLATYRFIPSSSKLQWLTGWGLHV